MKFRLKQFNMELTKKGGSIINSEAYACMYSSWNIIQKWVSNPNEAYIFNSNNIEDMTVINHTILESISTIGHIKYKLPQYKGCLINTGYQIEIVETNNNEKLKKINKKIL